MALVIALTVVFAGVSVQSINVEAASVPTIEYRAHVQNIGWMGTVKNGAMAGTTGKSLQLEALQIKLKSGSTNMIEYRAHVKNKGWLSWVTSGETAGRTGESRRMEAIQIKLKNSYAKKYDVYYRVHVAYAGWLGWAKNGERAGSVGYGLAIEAIEIKLVKKGSKFSVVGASELSMPKLTYQAHVQNKGWMKSTSEGNTAGTVNQSLRLEAFKINLKDLNGKNGILYQAHVAGIGWESGWRKTGEIAGTVGKSRAVEAVKIKLRGSLADCLDVYYRVQVQNYGWLGWAKNGAIAGTTNGSIRAEAIQIVIKKKPDSFNTGSAAYLNLEKSISMLRKKFPNDAYWNHVVKPGHNSAMCNVAGCNNPDGYTWTCCGTHDGIVGVGGYDCNSFDGASQCRGFALKCAYDLYGNSARNWSTTTSIAGIKPGDVLVYKDGRTDPKWGHTVFVIGVNGSIISVAECNIDARCKIRWDRTINLNNISVVDCMVAPYEAH